MSQTVTKSPNGESKEIKVQKVNKKIEDMLSEGGMALCTQVFDIDDFSRSLPNGAPPDGGSSGSSKLEIKTETSGRISSEQLVTDGMFVLVDGETKETGEKKKDNKEKDTRNDE